ncbi:MAG: hypothetical protein HZC48_06420 [Nitrospirae bacterium]|nr:hypothetical protein [Nitrospirota bacterium]
MIRKCTVIILIFLVVITGYEAYAVTAKLPKIRPSLSALDLSKPPTNEDIMAAGQLGGQLYPTHEIKDKEKEKKTNQSFGEAIQEWNKHEYKKAVKLFKKHIEEYPDSPWASEAVLHMGCDASYSGRYTEAEESFKWIIETNKGKDHEGAKILINKAKLRLGNLKVYQNNFEGAKVLFRELIQESADWRDRTYASHWIQRLSRYTTNELAMMNCGTQALAYLLEKDGKKEEARKVFELLPDTIQGHSIKALSDIASTYGYHLTALKLNNSQVKDLPLPAIMHVNSKNQGDSGHYWILDKVEGDSLGLFDPQAGRRFQQNIDEFSKEWSGNALVFSDKGNLPGTKLAESEMGRVFGGCCGVPRPEEKQGCPGGNAGPRSSGGACCGGFPSIMTMTNSYGSPAWSVNMVNFNLFVTDTPLWYSPPIGPSVEISLSYNSQSAIAYNEPFGNKWQFNYASYLVADTGGQVTIFMPGGSRDVFSPDGAGGYYRPYQVFNTLTKIAENHFELKFPDDTVYVYNIPLGTTSLQPFLVEIRDSYGQKLSIGYNADIQLSTITDASAKVTTLTYNADGLVTAIADPFGRSAQFEYDLNRNLTKITDMGGYWSSLSYDDDVYVTGIEDSRGKWEFNIEPSGSGAMWERYRITVTSPLNTKEEYYYSGTGYAWYVNPNDYASPNPPKIIYSYASIGTMGEISSISYPGGGNSSFGYDSYGNRTSVTDSHGHTTNYTYNDLGRVTSMTDAMGNVTNMAYDTNGVDLVQIVNGLGTVTMAYNTTHDVTSITDRLNNTTAFTYNSFGQIASQTNAVSIATNYTYNGSHLLQQVTKDGKTLDSFTYDSVGRIKTHTDATGLNLAYDYNNLNNITKTTYPDGKFTSYAYSSCCPRLIDSMTDRSGRTTAYFYDALKRVTDIVTPEGGVTKNVYDANGNLLKLIDPNGNITTFSYNTENRLIKKTFADGKYTSFAYDTAGLLTTLTNARGISTSYTYDQNHNLLSLDYSDGSTPGVTYQYDNYNRATQRQDATGTYQFSYDANSRVTGIDDPWADDSLTYSYDALGRRIGLVPQGGQAISYAYDNLSRLTGIQSGANTYSYSYSNANPLVQTLTRPNGSNTAYQYDSLDRLTGIANKTSAAAIINQYVYDYNQQDVRSSETITNGNPITSFTNELITYDYNKVNQLLSSTNPNKTFAYDDDGNMTQGYTPEGYVFTAAYDAENRLMSLQYTDNGGVVHKTEYLYGGDSFLAEMKKYDNAALISDTRYVRDGSLALQERDANNNIIREYAWGLNMGGGIGGLLNLKQSGQDYSYLYDGKGNVVALLDGTQAVVAAYTYDTFGNLMSKTGTLNQPMQFSTKSYDEKTGLSYYGYRFYSPALGRWINRDPLGESGGMNLYGFVENNSMNVVDSLGLDTYYINNNIPSLFGNYMPTNSFLSHSFIAITDSNGVVTDTYSWTDQKGGSWHHNYWQDVNGAQAAIEKGIGMWHEGNDDLDEFIKSEFDKMENEERGFYGRRGTCKMQARKLLKTAKEKRDININGPLPP